MSLPFPSAPYKLIDSPLLFSITLGLYHDPAHTPTHYSDYTWPGFGVALAINVIGLIVVVTRRDITWAVASTWICVAVFTARPKPVPVNVRSPSLSSLLPVPSFADVFVFVRRS